MALGGGRQSGAATEAARRPYHFDATVTIAVSHDALAPYTPPGHVPVKHEPGTEMLLFSPAEELRETAAAMTKNMQAMQAG